MNVCIRRRLGWLIFCLAAVLLPLQSMAQTGDVSGGKTRWITDAMGRRVQVADPLNRVALFGGPTGQVVYILGARSQICAVTSSFKGSNTSAPSILR